jgi:transcriptional regulator with XRE-family HTH domain
MTKAMTTAQVIALMKKKQGNRTSKEFAKELGISAAYLCDIYRNNREPGESVLTKLGIVKRIVYEPQSA